MKKLINKYVDKLVSQGVCESGEPVLGGLDAKIVWNKHSQKTKILEKVIDGLNINSILFSKPAEPYASIINFLSKTQESAIYPQDCETRTFLHDIPIVADFEPAKIINALKKRKAAIIPNQGIITFGTVSPEQAFISYSSVCFSCFVKFFTDYYKDVQAQKQTTEQNNIFKNAFDTYYNFIHDYKDSTLWFKGPLKNSETTIKAMIQAGKLVVDYRLVDSFFGNISYRLDNTIYISQTTSSLDELAGCIDPCPIDNSTCTALTASSELSAHKEILLNCKNKAILHGHPKFSVIMSMLCKEEDSCSTYGECHIKCPKKRFIKDVPVVPGEVGTGKYGLSNTLPPAIKNNRGVIVYGHGLFTVGKNDFTDAFKNLLDIEKMCLDAYFLAVKT